MSVSPVVAGVAMLLAATPTAAQTLELPSASDDQAGPDALEYLRETPAEEQPDVLLHIPDLLVEEIKVDALNVDLSLNAQVSELVQLRAGAEVAIGDTTLVLKGAKTEATLVIRLDNVRAIVGRALQALETSPELLSAARRPAAGQADASGAEAPSD